MPPRDRAPGPRPDRRGRAAAACRCGWSCVIRFDYGIDRAVGAHASTAALRAIARARHAVVLRTPVDHARRGSDDGGRVRGRRGRHACRSCSTWHPSHEPTAERRRRRARRCRDTDGVVARVVGALHATRASGARPVRPLADHAEGADLRAHRRHRRRADHLAARAARRRAQLGLPLLLAARRDVHALRADARPATSTRRAPGATGCCAPSPATRRSCRSCTASPASGG